MMVWELLVICQAKLKIRKKNMPLGLILTAVIVLALYAGLTFVDSGILSIDEMATSDAPIALLASKLPGIGQYAGTIVAIMAIIVVIGSLSSCIMFQPRIEYAMAKDNLFFKSFAKSSSKIRNSLFFNYRTVCGCNRINFCFKLVSIARILYNGSIIKECAYIRYNLCASKKGKEHGYDPSYKCPGGPIMPLIAIIMTGTLIWGQLTYAPMQSLICAFVAVVTGLPVFYYWDRKNKKESA